MTNDIRYEYTPNKRLGFNPSPSHKMARLFEISTAVEQDVFEIWELSKFHKHTNSIPFKDSIEHLIRNPRCVSSIGVIYTTEVPASFPDTECLEGLVKEEEVVAFCVVAPVDRPTAKTNYIQVAIPCLTFNLSLGEEEIAQVIYETLHQYCAAKINTIAPTKLEVTVWLSPQETNFFKIVVGYINAIFQDSYLPIRLPEVSHNVTDNNTKPLCLGKPSKSSKNLLLRQRQNLNNPDNYGQVKHEIIFPRLPGPPK